MAFNAQRCRLTERCGDELPSLLRASLFILLSVTTTRADSPAFKLIHSDQSPKGDILIQEFQRQEKDGSHTNEIRLAKSSDPQHVQLLFEHHRGASVIMSSDESRIAINDYVGSNIADVVIFQQVKELEYKESISEETIRKKTLAALSHSLGRTDEVPFDHLYVECLAWAADSSAVLLRLHGHDSGISALDDWFCVFELKNQTISFDLAAINRHSFVELHK
jgi:hypothetical protein